MKITIPIKTVSEANAHTHWRIRAKRAKEQRGLAALLCRAEIGTPPAVPLTITITRLAPGTLDSDNLAGSQKHVRDGIADWLGVDDRSPLIDWRYAQEKAARGVYFVRIEIEPGRRP